MIFSFSNGVAIRADAVELQMMSFDGEAGLNAEQLLNQRQLAGLEFHYLATAFAHQGMGVFRSAGDKPVFPIRVMDPAQAPNLLERFNGPINGDFADARILEGGDRFGDGQPARAVFKQLKNPTALAGEPHTEPVELTLKLIQGHIFADLLHVFY